MKNKKVLIIMTAVIFVLGAVVGGTYYWWIGTPEYSFKKMQEAFRNHNTTAFNKYFDTDTIFNNFWQRVVVQANNVIQNDDTSSELSKQIQSAQISSLSTSTKQTYQTDVYNLVLGKTTQGGEFKHTVLEGLMASNSTFKITDKVAMADYVDDDSATNNPQNYPVYKLKIIMQEQSDRTWKIVDIQGYEDVRGALLTDNQRVKDLTTIGNLVNNYLSDSEKPTLTNDNWRDSVTAYSVKKGKSSSVPEDKLVYYSDNNKYAFAIQNADSLQTYEYVIRAKLSTVNNNVFKSKYSQQNLSYSELISKISGGTNKILDIDCNASEYCYLGYGLSSDWSKVLK